MQSNQATESTGAWRRRRAFFAAANSAAGFYSLYDELFSGQTERYVLQGGPGTGKSRLLWEMTQAGERAGFTAELFYCSSDPSSLDGVILSHRDGRQLALVDGTAPHLLPTTLPGARDHLIDLGAFWSGTALAARRGEIEQHMQDKAAAFGQAYRYLLAAGECERNRMELLRPYGEAPATQRLLRRLLSGTTVTRCGRGEVRRVFARAHGMQGTVRLTTPERSAKRICRLLPHYGMEHRILQELWRAGEQSGQRMTVVLDPLLPLRPESIWLEDEGVLFTLLPEPRADDTPPADYVRAVSLRRLLPREELSRLRPALREAQHCRDQLLTAALQALHATAAPHFALEQIYGDAMDFSAKEQYTAQLAQTLFGKQAH